MIEELLRYKLIIDEEYIDTINDIDNRIKIISKNMFIIYSNYYKQNFIITNPFYKYNIELNMKYILFDNIDKCIDRLNTNNNVIHNDINNYINNGINNNINNDINNDITENNYKIYNSFENRKSVIINIKYLESKYLFIEYNEDIPIGKENLLQILNYIKTNEIYNIVKNIFYTK